MTATKLREHLTGLGACVEAMEWIGERTAREAWEQCGRADWLLWWAGRTPANSHQQIVLAACDCARRALRHIPAGEERPRQAIEAAERWEMEPTEVNRLAAWRAAWAARRAARAADAAADAAAWAAWAAADAVWAAAGAPPVREVARENIRMEFDAETDVSARPMAAATPRPGPVLRAMCAVIRERLVLPWEEDGQRARGLERR